MPRDLHSNLKNDLEWIEYVHKSFLSPSASKLSDAVISALIHTAEDNTTRAISAEAEAAEWERQAMINRDKMIERGNRIEVLEAEVETLRLTYDRRHRS